MPIRMSDKAHTQFGKHDVRAHWESTPRVSKRNKHGVALVDKTPEKIMLAVLVQFSDAIDPAQLTLEYDNEIARDQDQAILSTAIELRDTTIEHVSSIVGFSEVDSPPSTFFGRLKVLFFGE